MAELVLGADDRASDGGLMTAGDDELMAERACDDRVGDDRVGDGTELVIGADCTIELVTGRRCPNTTGPGAGTQQVTGG